MPIELFIEEEQWLSEQSEKKWMSSFERLLNAIEKFPNKRVDVTLTSDLVIKKINKQYRKIDKTTNVLSFPQYDITELKNMPNTKKILLGDVVMAYNSIKEEASMFGKTLHDRVCHLFVHGVLHNMGYSHIVEYDRIEMERLEALALLSINISNPYIAGGKF